MMKIKSLFIKKYNGFSLMEMMTVMLIISILAAFSAPMVNRKIMSTMAQKSPWERNGAGIIFYNKTPSDSHSAIIGAMKKNDKAENAKLQITTSGTIPFIALNNGDSSLKFRFANSGIAINTVVNEKPAANSVAIGADAIAAKDSVAIGHDADAKSSAIIAYIPFENNFAKDWFKNLIAPAFADITTPSEGQDHYYLNFQEDRLSKDDYFEGNSDPEPDPETDPPAIDPSAGSGSVSGAIAIGKDAKAKFTNSIAIGAGATTSTENQIVLGGTASTVYIPGNLVVDGDVYLGVSTGKKVVARVPENTGELDYLQKLQHFSGGGWLFRALNNPDPFDIPGKSDAVTSDRRLKNVGATFEGGLDQIRKLEVFNYTFKKDKSKTPRVGVMAQDLEKIYPNAVTKGDDGFLRIRMEDMFYSMVNAIKELDKNLINRSNKLVTLEKDSKSIEKSLARIEKRIAKLERKIK